MTIFRNNSEPSPMPATNEQIAESATLTRKPEGPRAVPFTGADVGLSQSLADLKKGYTDATKLQSDAARDAIIARANVDAKIEANTPALGVEFFGHRPEQYETGDSSQVPSSDPMWRMPVEHLRENLELAQAIYGKNGALNKALSSRSPEDVAHAAELGERMQRSLDRDVPRDPQTVEGQPAPQPQQPEPQARPETFPDGEVVHVTQNSDGTLSAEYITGERFTGEPLAITQQIAKSHIQTKKWAQQQRAPTQQQPQNGNGAVPLIPSSQVQYDEYGTPILAEGQSAIPDQTFVQLHQMAQALGYTDANEMVADQMNLRAQTDRLSQELAAEREDRQNKEVASRFMAEHPDFPNDERSIEALSEVITRNNLDWNSENMALAHTYAVKNGMYAPLSVEEQQAALGMSVQSQRPTPPPMIRGNSPETSSWQGENDVYKIPLDELRKQAIRQQLEGKAPSLNYR